MNSVGHMARTKVERELTKNPAHAARLAGIARDKLVYWALPTAMKTIGPPMDGSRGTWLAPHGTFDEDKEPPTFEPRPRYFGDLAQFSEKRYKGRYHTDHTIPSTYFDESLWRAEELPERDDLYFNYLHKLGDIDYQEVAVGLELGVTHGSATEAANLAQEPQ